MTTDLGFYAMAFNAFLNKFGPPIVGSLFFRSPSMIYISQQQLVNITSILSDGATT